jgi:hypothetical protein
MVNVNQIRDRKAELEKEKQMFYKFLTDAYGEKDTEEKIEKHLWRINKQIEILEWVLDESLPF